MRSCLCMARTIPGYTSGTSRPHCTESVPVILFHAEAQMLCANGYQLMSLRLDTDAKLPDVPAPGGHHHLDSSSGILMWD